MLPQLLITVLAIHAQALRALLVIWILIGTKTGTCLAQNNCTSPVSLSINEQRAFSYSGATTQSQGQSLIGCGTSWLDNDLWYNLTTSQAGNFQITVCATVAPKIALYRGHGCLGQLIACNDGAGTCGNGFQARIIYYASGSEQLRLQVGTRNSGPSSGTGTIQFVSVPAGLSCDVPLILEGTQAQADFTSSTFVQDPSSQYCSGLYPQAAPARWVAWTAPASGRTVIAVTNTSEITPDNQVKRLTVFQGSGCNGVPLVCQPAVAACEGGWNYSMWSQFDAISGQAYLIQVFGTLGRFSLALDPSGADEPPVAPVLTGQLIGATLFSDRQHSYAFGFGAASLSGGISPSVMTSDDGEVVIGRDVWVKVPMGVQVATCGLTDADTTLSVYTILGDGSPGRFVTANHRSVAGANGSYVYVPRTGNQYYVRIGLVQGATPGRGFVVVYQGQPPTERRCTIDIAGLGGTYGPDSQITTDDLVLYLGAFFQNDMTIADKVATGGTGQPDSVVSVDDLVFFLSQFFGPYNQCRVN